MTQGKKILLTILACILVALFAVLPAAMQQAREAAGKAKIYVLEQIEHTLGYKVSFEQVNISLLQNIELSGITVYDIDGRPMVTAESATVSFNWRSMVGDPAAEHIERIVVKKPVVHIWQHPDHKWNIEHFIDKQKQSDGPSQKFYAKIRITDGRILVDNLAKMVEVTGLQASLDFSTPDMLQFEATAQHTKTSLLAKGKLNIAHLQGAVEIEANNGDLAEYSEFIPQNEVFAAQGGKFTAHIQLGGNLDNKPLVYGQIQLNDVSGRLLAYEADMEQLSGTVKFDNKVIALSEVTGLVNNQPLSVNGSVAYNALEPKLDLNITSTHFRPERALAWLHIPFAGDTTFQLKIVGQPSALSVSGQLAVSEGIVKDIPLSGVQTRFSYQGSKLYVHELEGQVFGGKVTGTGSVLVADQPVYSLAVTALGIDAAKLPQLPTELQGKINVKAYVSGHGADLNTMTAWGSAEAVNAKYQNIVIDRVLAGGALMGGKAKLDYAHVNIGSGTIHATGELQLGGEIDVRLFADRLPLAQLGTLHPKLALDGTANFRGKITGQTVNPQLEGLLAVNKGKVMTYKFDSINAKVQADAKQVSLGQGLFRQGQSEHTFKASLQLAADPVLEAVVTSKRIRAEDLLQLAEVAQPLTGNVYNEVTARGPLSNIRVEGQVTLIDGSYHSQLIHKAAVHYQYSDHVLIFDNLDITSPTGNIQGTGWMDRDRNLNIHISGKNLNVSHLRLPDSFKVQASADFKAEITGTPSAPIADGEFILVNPIVNNLKFDRIQGFVKYADGAVEATNIKLLHDSEQYDMYGRLTLAGDQDIEGGLVADDVKLSSLLNLFNIPNRRVEGLAKGKAVFSGTLKEPQATAKFSVKQGQLNGYPLDSIDVDAALENHVIKVKQLKMKQGEGLLEAEGSVDLHGEMVVEARAQKIEAGIITAFLPLEQQIGGKISLEGLVGGTFKHPTAAVVVSIEGGAIGSVEFDRLSASISADEKAINLSQGMLVKGSHRATVNGMIPIGALTKSGRSSLTDDDKMNVKVKLENTNLSILSLFSKEIKMADGELKGELTITGTGVHPVINGAATIRKGWITLNSLNEKVEDIQADVVFNTNQVTIPAITARVGGGDIKLDGEIAIKDLAIDNVKLDLAVNRVKLSSKLGKGSLDAQMQFITQNGRHIIKGNVDATGASVLVPLPLPASEPSNYDVDLDVRCNIDNTIRVYNPMFFDIWAKGNVHVQGTVKDPRLSGNVTAVRGTAKYLQTSFKITEAKADFTQMNGIMPVVNAKAETRIGKTVIYLTMAGPIENISNNPPKLYSEPVKTFDEIVKLLTLRSPSESDSGEGTRINYTDIAKNAGTVVISGWVERWLQDSLGLDEVKIESVIAEGPVSQEAYNFQFGKYVNKKVMVSLGKRTDNARFSYGMRYDLTARMGLEWSLDEEQETRINLSMKFPF